MEEKVNILEENKNICSACDQEITGKGVIALSKMWHPEHFQCKACQSQITSELFFEHDGEPYCEEDYNSLFLNKCAECDKPIKDSCVVALGKNWHRECFHCTECEEALAGDTFMEKDGKPYCKEDYHKLFTMKCHACGEPILDTCVIAVGKNWHKKCFVCKECKETIDTSNFTIEDDVPKCLQCSQIEASMNG